MTELTLLADLAANYGYKAIGPSVIVEPEDSKGVTRKQVNVFESGKSEKDQKPTAYRKNIDIYVYKAGQPEEEAFYGVQEPTNSVNTDVAAAADTLQSYSTIFSSAQLRIRVVGAIIKAAVYFIGVGTPGGNLNWAYDAIKDPGKYLNSFMCECANNSTIRTQGNKIGDADLDYVVNVNIPIVKAAYGF